MRSYGSEIVCSVTMPSLMSPTPNADLSKVEQEHDHGDEDECSHEEHRLSILLQHAHLILHDHPFPEAPDLEEKGQQWLPLRPPPFSSASSPIYADQLPPESSIASCYLASSSPQQNSCEFSLHAVVELPQRTEAEAFLHGASPNLEESMADVLCTQESDFVSRDFVGLSDDSLLVPKLEGNDFLEVLPSSCQLDSQTHGYDYRPDGTFSSLSSSKSLICRPQVNPELPSSLQIESVSSISSKSLACTRKVRKAFRLLQKSRPLQILDKSDRKRSRPSKCCFGCEAGTKKKRHKLHDSACTSSWIVSEMTSNAIITQIPEERGLGFYRVSNAILALPAFFPDVENRRKNKGLPRVPKEGCCDRRKSSQTSHNWTLFEALGAVVSEAGDDGLTVSQAVQKLVERGLSWVFKLGHKSRFSQVERALKKKGDFMELAGSRFVTCHLRGSQNQVKAVVPEPVVGAVDSNNGLLIENQSDLLQYCLDILEEREPEHRGRCHKSDGKGWQCLQRAVYGSAYCKHHSQNINQCASTLLCDSRQVEQSIICHGVANSDGQEESIPFAELEPTGHHFLSGSSTELREAERW